MQDASPRSPVRWARTGRLAQALARAIPTQGQPILVLSMPRSGSSWVGEELGSASNALYLREPVTQGDPVFYRMGTVFDPVASGVEDSYRRLADRAFRGLPAFEPHVVTMPGQWALNRRPGRRVVVKEVNPLACRWYVDRYRPKVVFLVRHPAAVALSMFRKGWMGPSDADWRRVGVLQGSSVRIALDVLERYEDHTTVVYEDACQDPLGVFPNLFAFAGLTWDAAAQAFLERHTRQDADDVHGTTRDSRRMVDRWRSGVTRDQARALREGFAPFDLPWYRSDADWAIHEGAANAA